MQARHRIPTIFSLYMVDVLCCALGCVVLLWQLYHYEAQEQTARANEETVRANEQTARANEQTVRANEQTAKVNASLVREQSINQDLLAANYQLKQAQVSIKSFSSEVQGLKLALDAKNKQVIQLTLELDDTREDRDKKGKLALVYKQDYDQLLINKKLVDATLFSLSSEHKILQQKEKQTKAQLTTTNAQLADKIKAHADVLDKMAAVEKRISVLEKEMSIQLGELVARNKKIADRDALLKNAEEKTKKLEKLREELLAQGKLYLSKLSEAELRARLLEQDLSIGKKGYRDLQRRMLDLIADKESLNNKVLISAKDLEGAKLALVAIKDDQDSLKGKLMLSVKELADAKVLANALQGDKANLLKQNKAIQAAADNRFAGITLTGTKVVFMVDMSGSMDLIDEKTADPDKWPLVCEIVGKLMKSLPDLKEYQVILFSDKVRYPLSNEGRWLTYHPDRSVKITVAALKAIKPRSETNLYAAFEETFKYRDQGMDAIYLFSDGLPNAGPGLPPGGEKLSESEQGVHLGKYLRNKLKTWNRPLAGQKVPINAVGFFFESPDLGAFLWTLAREHEGSFVGMSRP